jgi:WD40 repeat protein
VPGRDGPVPARIFPVFRDREELPSSADLNDQIRSALEASAVLVVVCSPNAAASRWVNEEILTFKRMGRSDRILAVIIDGEPNASDTPGSDAALECFPPALRHRIGPGGTLTEERVEPVAADARPEADGEENARLKVIAGILGVGFGQLKQRDLEAQRRRLQKLAAISGSVALALAALTVLSLYFARQARQERNTALRHLGDSYAAHAADLAAVGRFDAAARAALLGLRLSHGTSARAVDVLRYAAPRIRLRWRFPLNAVRNASAQLSPDERRLLTTDGNDAVMFDMETGASIMTIRGHSATLRAARFSPDGSQVLTASEDGTARLWDSRDGRALATIGKAGTGLVFADFWRNGDAIVTATFDGDIRIWDARRQSQIALLNTRDVARALIQGAEPADLGMMGGIDTLRLSADGRKIVAITRMFAPALFVFDADGNSAIGLAGSMSGISDVRVSLDSTRIGLVSMDGKMEIADAATGNVVRSEVSAKPLGAIAFSSDNRLLAFVSADRDVRVQDVGSGAGWTLPVSPARAIRTIAFSPDSAHLVVGLENGVLESWSMSDRRHVASFSGHVDMPTSIEFTKDSSLMVTSSLDGSVRVWNWRKTADPVRTIPLTSGLVSDLATAGSRLLATDGDRLVAIEPGTGQVRDWKRDGRIVSMTPSPDASSVYVADEANTAAIQNLSTGVTLALESGDDAEPASGSWSPDGSLIAAAAMNGIIVWDARTGRIVRQIKLPSGRKATVAAFAADGRRLFALDDAGKLQAWTLEGAASFSFGTAPHDVFDVSRQGDVVTGGPGGDVRVWDGRTGTLKGSLLGHGRSSFGTGIYSVAFSDDGRYAASKGADEPARVWDLQTMREVRAFASEWLEGCIGFLPGSTEVVAGDGDNDAAVVSLATGQIVATIPGSQCPVFTADRRFTATASASVDVWEVSRLTLSADALVQEACGGNQLPVTARTFTRAEGDADPLIHGMRLTPAGAEIDACTGEAAIQVAVETAPVSSEGVPAFAEPPSTEEAMFEEWRKQLQATGNVAERGLRAEARQESGKLLETARTMARWFGKRPSMLLVLVQSMSIHAGALADLGEVEGARNLLKEALGLLDAAGRSGFLDERGQQLRAEVASMLAEIGTPTPVPAPSAP